MRTVIFSLIPLILSIGIAPMLSFAESESPRKQMANGVSAENVVCKSGFTLMIRMSGDAACVMPSTAEKLETVGWGTIEKEFSENTEVTDTESTEELEEELEIESEVTDTESTEEGGKDLSVEFSESIALKGN